MNGITCWGFLSVGAALCFQKDIRTMCRVGGVRVGFAPLGVVRPEAQGIPTREPLLFHGD